MLFADHDHERCQLLIGLHFRTLTYVLCQFSMGAISFAVSTFAATMHKISSTMKIPAIIGSAWLKML